MSIELADPIFDSTELSHDQMEKPTDCYFCGRLFDINDLHEIQDNDDSVGYVGTMDCCGDCKKEHGL